MSLEQKLLIILIKKIVIIFIEKKNHSQPRGHEGIGI
jgi:hypothetical protein